MHVHIVSLGSTNKKNNINPMELKIQAWKKIDKKENYIYIYSFIIDIYSSTYQEHILVQYTTNTEHHRKSS